MESVNASNLAVVAGLGGVVALVVAYRKQRLGETAEFREQSKAMTERFGAAAEQLGSDQPPVRMAGANAMAWLADDWLQHRQICIDVLCGYLRMPHSAEPPEDEQAAAAWQRERAVRLTVLRLIAAHLRDDAAETWRGYDLDFTGAVIDEADFRGARFTGGDIIFINAIFVAHGHDQVVFDEVEFAEGSSVYFRLAEFRGGEKHHTASNYLPALRYPTCGDCLAPGRRAAPRVSAQPTSSRSASAEATGTSSGRRYWWCQPGVMP